MLAHSQVDITAEGSNVTQGIGKLPAVPRRMAACQARKEIISQFESESAIGLNQKRGAVRRKIVPEVIVTLGLGP